MALTVLIFTKPTNTQQQYVRYLLHRITTLDNKICNSNIQLIQLAWRSTGVGLSEDTDY